MRLNPLLVIFWLGVGIYLVTAVAIVFAVLAIAAVAAVAAVLIGLCVGAASPSTPAVPVVAKAKALGIKDAVLLSALDDDRRDRVSEDNRLAIALIAARSEPKPAPEPEPARVEPVALREHDPHRYGTWADFVEAQLAAWRVKTAREREIAERREQPHPGYASLNAYVGKSKS
jgi:hypothetical protein